MHPGKPDPHASGDPSKAPARPCPICGKPSVLEVRPFCSKRCADIDLHRWLGGVYAVPAEPAGGAPSDPAEPNEE